MMLQSAYAFVEDIENLYTEEVENKEAEDIYHGLEGISTKLNRLRNYAFNYRISKIDSKDFQNFEKYVKEVMTILEKIDKILKDA